LNIKCKRIVKGKASGKLLLVNEPINFLGMVNSSTGDLLFEHDSYVKQSLKGTILIFPNSIGSSVGAYTIFALKKNNVSPNGMICTNIVDITTASGCAISNIPLASIGKDELNNVIAYCKSPSSEQQTLITLNTEKETIKLT
jgi:predicted aconitase with swiveling domain